MAANFDGEIAIETQPQDWTGIVSGKGADARSSSRASGNLTYRLTDGAAPDSTHVAIAAEFNLAGALAQFGKGPVIQEVANRITAAFVQNFESKLAAAPAAAAAPEGPAGPVAPASANTLNAGSLFWSILRDRVATVLRGLIPGSSARR
jgi:hypothetical protein